MRSVTAAERPELVAEMKRLGASPWPAFLNHDAVVEELWPSLYELAPDYQLALLEDGGALTAVANCVPFAWDGHPRTLPPGGVDAVLSQGLSMLREGCAPTAASALMIVVAPERLGQGCSALCIRAMADAVRARGLADLVAPVRPTQKHRYPLAPMARYARWRRADGSHFDPWLRVHERVGGELVGVAPAAMTVRGSVREWEEWTEMAFPETGHYVLPGGLVPVEIDMERGEGLYVEPAVWVRHRCG